MRLFRFVALAGAMAMACASAAGAVSLNGNTVKHVVGFDITNDDLVALNWWGPSTTSVALPQADTNRKLKSAKVRADYTFSGTQYIGVEDILNLNDQEDPGEDIFDYSVLFIGFLGYDIFTRDYHYVFGNQMYVFYGGISDCVIYQDEYDPGVLDLECVAGYGHAFSDAFPGTTDWVVADDLSPYVGPGSVPLVIGVDWWTNSFSPDYSSRP